jgi:hypothetical protein
MKFLTSTAIFLTLAVSLPAFSAKSQSLFVSPSFSITFYIDCNEIAVGEEKCPIVGHAYNTKNSSTIDLRGGEYMELKCGGRKPCHTAEAVYILRGESSTFHISSYGELVVKLDGKIVLVEQGEWK